MTTLTTAPLSGILDRLFVAEDASKAVLKRERANMDPGEIRSLMTSTTEYRARYARMKDAPLAVSRETGALLYLLARSTQARSIIEFGTSFGISTLHLAAALRDNGGGRLIGSEFEPSKVARARRSIEAAGLADLVEIRAGDALDTFASNLPDSIDLVLLDGAKGLYPAILSLVEPALHVGSLIVADNADWVPDYLSRVRSVASGYFSVPLSDELEISMKV